MASTGKSTAIYIQVLLALALVLLLAACVAGRGSNGLGLLVVSTPTTQTPLQCGLVYAVQTGDTCFAIANQASMDTKQFLTINPNLVCDHLFVGEWVCIKAN
ncbi:hypothetical protein MLD38_010007 [Melastoma candidum]|uniref:Uncharacterized protein n=1 Tax=Melastoma candidum TaxID=119954 RepID=A0ACB9R0A0_9MYRT|nr:hypothetical protein MLD38_010007 [Melastoma candidum]